MTPTTHRRVRKTGGSFQHTGTVVAEFTTLAGEPRVVLEFDAPVAGMLHVYRPDQVEALAAVDPAPAAEPKEPKVTVVLGLNPRLLEVAVDRAIQVERARLLEVVQMHRYRGREERLDNGYRIAEFSTEMLDAFDPSWQPMPPHDPDAWAALLTPVEKTK